MRRTLLVMLALVLAVSLGYAQTDIYDIQYVADPANDDASPMEDQEVTVHGWITFEPMSAGGNKFWVADDAGAWNGIYVYTGDNDCHFGFGWEVEITGTIEEYYNLTELNASEGTVTVINDVVDPNNLPAACAYTTVSATDLAGGAATAEQYEGVLIMVEDVQCTDPDLGYGEWEVGDGAGNNFAIDNPQDGVYGYSHTPMQDMPYEYVRGALTYTYNVYKIVPEIAYDLKVAVDTEEGWYIPIPWFQQVRPMDMTIQYDANDEPYTMDQSYASLARYGDDYEDTTFVTCHGIVTAPTGLYYAGDGVKFIMADYNEGADGDGNSAPWSAVLAYHPNAEAFPTLFVGDEIVFPGYVDEYDTDPAHMTELWLTAATPVISGNNPVPVPTVVNTEDLRDPMRAEQWGNVFVDVQNSVVTNDGLQYEIMAIDDNLDDDWLSINVDDDSDSLNRAEYPIPPLGTVLTSINGWVYHHFGAFDAEFDWVYKLVPQGPASIVIGEGPPNYLSVGRNPGAPMADEDVTITAEIADNSQVTSASIFWKIGNDGSWTEVAMTNTGGIEWEGTIPGQAEGSLVWYYLIAEDDIETTTTYPSDIENDMLGFWNTDNLDIYNVQYTPFASGWSPYEGNLVTLTGVVTTSSANFNTYGGHFIQLNVTDNPEFSGICATIPAEVAAPEMGDIVTITGTVDEEGEEYAYKWGGNTKLLNVVDCQINGNETPVFYDVTCAGIADHLEEWESVLVQFTDIEITSVNSYDWTFEDASGATFLLDGDIVIDDTLEAWAGGLEVGTTLDAVRGIITYSFGSWKVEVRQPSDLGESAAPESEVYYPVDFVLEQNYPNPFNPTTHIRYGVPNTARVQVIVYNQLGQVVREIVDEVQDAGYYSVVWDGMTSQGTVVASGTYYLRLLTDGRQIVRKMALVR